MKNKHGFKGLILLLSSLLVFGGCTKEDTSSSNLVI